MTSRDPKNLIGLAEIYQEKDQIQKAKTLVEEALSFWSEADADFIPKKKAELFLIELQS